MAADPAAAAEPDTPPAPAEVPPEPDAAIARDGPQEEPEDPADAPAGFDDALDADVAPVREAVEAKNYRIGPDDHLGSGGAAVKYADNVRAIRILKELERDGADAGPEEQRALVRYVGWGGMPQVFDPTNREWAAQHEELRRLLDAEEYENARRSTQDAHYTSETVIRGIYDGLARLGVRGDDAAPLRILEPAAGIGNFMGLCPAGLKAAFTAVEQDSVSSRIARKLYPEATHVHNGYQRVSIGSDKYDVALGNPPFGSQRLFDAQHPELSRFSIHNYFLAKSIDKVREGGVAAFVVSRFFLDAQDPSVREHIARKADFLGAIRLPETAFRQNALTDVTTDIVFFRKTGNPTSTAWLETRNITVWNDKEKLWEEAPVNAWFADNPGQMIGSMRKSGGAFRDAMNCVTDGEVDLGAEISRRLEALPQDVFAPAPPRAEIRERRLDREFLASEYFRNLKIGAYCVEPGTGAIVSKEQGELGAETYAPVPLRRDSERSRLAGIIGIRDALRALLEEEKKKDADEARLASLRGSLNARYDAFVRKFGLLNSQTNRSVFGNDPEHALVQSLENNYDKGVPAETAKRTGRTPRPPSAQKAAIFRRRVMEPAAPATHADSVQDALILSLRERGRIDFDRIAELAEVSPDDARQDLRWQELIFLNPESGDWEIRDRYLSGNVRAKLHAAERAAQDDPDFAGNVEALRGVMPQAIEAVDIGVQFGATWVPPRVMEQFLDEVILEDSGGSRSVSYIPALGRWDARVAIHDRSRSTGVWGIPEYPAEKLIESLLHNTPIKVMKDSGSTDSFGNPILVVDQELTAAAMQKADEIRRAFKDWIWTDDERREELTSLYNERFNTHIPPRYDGRHVELVNASAEVRLRPHQKDVIWRGVQEGTGLFDHVVGAGKTLACIATIMESKRMGFLRKPMVVVPNHLLYQWRDEFYRLYPDANILVADRNDFTRQNRERLFSRVATGDWDAVIVAHSSFGKIEMPRETQEEILREQIDAVVEAIAAAKDGGGSRATVKQLEKQREKMRERYESLMARGGPRDGAVDFADLGVDGLFVDESQEFKNLGFSTSMNVSGLGNITGSAKALDLFVKCRYLQKKHDGRGVYFLTGTPISNSIAEVYTLQRYLQYDELAKKEINHFDSWASTFGQVTDAWELDATGVNYKLKSRFSSFQNVPELLSMYRSFADVVTKKDLDAQAQEAGLRPLTPPVEGGAPRNIVVGRSPAQASYMEEIIRRMENLPPDPREDNPLKVTNDARKAGLDYRLIEPNAEDHAESKINAAVRRIYDIWQETRDVRGTQLVFCDLSTPKGGPPAPPADAPPAKAEDDNMVEGADEGAAAVPDMDELVALQGAGKFSVYDDVRQKLVAMGVPAEEIAFIHDANTDQRKARLFGDMQSGNVRILLGSTAKMGAGTNVQKRLVAAHHLDAPWRPSDLEQRNGRIIRQGNQLYERDPDNFKVKIFYYATERTYDARMWQTIEYKAAAIEQFRKGDILQREIEDVSSEAANAAEMKAAASGNPLILHQVRLASDLRRLEALHSQHQRTQHRLRDRLRWLQAAESRFEKARETFEANTKLRDDGTRRVTEKGHEKIRTLLVADGRTIDGDAHRQELHDHFMQILRQVPRLRGGEELAVGAYRGFTLSVFQKRVGDSNFHFSLRGANDTVMYPDNLGGYVFGEKFSLSGLFQRVDNILDRKLQQQFDDAERRLAKERAELRTVEAGLGQEFPQKRELELTRENHAAVLAELKRMQNDPEYVSEWTPKTLPPELPGLAAGPGPAEAQPAAGTAESSPPPAEAVSASAAPADGERERRRSRWRA